MASSNFHKLLGSKKYVIEFTVGLAICMPRFMMLAQVDQILDRGHDSSPYAIIDPKSPGQIGLKPYVKVDKEILKFDDTEIEK